MASASRVSRVGVAGALPPRALVLPSFREARPSAHARDKPVSLLAGTSTLATWRCAARGRAARAQRALGRYRRHDTAVHPSRQTALPSRILGAASYVGTPARRLPPRTGLAASPGLPVQRRPQPARRPRGRPPHLQAPRVIPRRHRDRGLPHATLRPPPPPPRPPPLRPPRRDQTPRRGPRRHALRRRQSRQSRRGRRGERRGRATSPVHLRHRPSNPRPEALPPKGRTQTRPGEYRPLPGGGRRERRGARRRRATLAILKILVRERAYLLFKGSASSVVADVAEKKPDTSRGCYGDSARVDPLVWAPLGRRSARRCGPSLSARTATPTAPGSIATV